MPPTLPDLGLFAVLGTIGVTAHTMLAHAFARLEAARLAPLQYVTLVWGVLFGFLFFAEVPGLATLAGARPDRGRHARSRSGAGEIVIPAQAGTQPQLRSVGLDSRSRARAWRE